MDNSRFRLLSNRLPCRMQKICLIHTSVGTLDDAKMVATGLLRNHIAACVQISSPGVSIYHWQGELQQSDERYLSIKAASAQRRHVIDWLERHHPYELPEIVWSEYSTTEAYADWVRAAGQLADHQPHETT